MGVVGVNLGARNDLLPSLAHLESKRERWAALAAPDGGHGARRRGGEWCFLLISKSSASVLKLCSAAPAGD